MSQLGEGLTRLASKDLTFRLSAEMPPAYRRLRDDFNTAIEQLEAALRNVSHTSQGVESGSRMIATAANDLSTRTEQQASRLEETSASLGEITSTVRKTADGATRARPRRPRRKTTGRNSSPGGS